MAYIKLSSAWNPILGPYKPKEWLGQGSTGEVIKAKHRATDKSVAIKKIRLDLQPSRRQVQREIGILRQLAKIPNPHVVKLREVVTTFDEEEGEVVFLVMEYLPLTLEDFLDNRYDFGEKEVVKVLYNILCALNFLHSANVMHRDIKPSNILLDEDLNVKLCDFGLARCIPSEDSSPTGRRLSINVVSEGYRPPEVILGDASYNELIDIWSAGCSIAEMIKCQTCYSKENQGSRKLFAIPQSPPSTPDACAPQRQASSSIDQLKSIVQVIGHVSKKDCNFIEGPRPQLIKDSNSPLPKIDFSYEFDQNSLGLARILTQMLQFNPNLRRPAKELLKAPLFDSVRSASKQAESEVEIEED